MTCHLFAVKCDDGYITCRLGLVADQRRGFRGDNGCVAQSVLCGQCYPLVHLRFWGGIASCLHLSITWKDLTFGSIQWNTPVNTALTTDSSAEEVFASQCLPVVIQSCTQIRTHNQTLRDLSQTTYFSAAVTWTFCQHNSFSSLFKLEYKIHWISCLKNPLQCLKYIHKRFFWGIKTSSKGDICFQKSPVVPVSCRIVCRHSFGNPLSTLLPVPRALQILISPRLRRISDYMLLSLKR